MEFAFFLKQRPADFYGWPINQTGNLKLGNLKLSIGYGWDSHEFKRGIPLKIGGLTLPYPKGLGGHSDGDVLLHVLGADRPLLILVLFFRRRMPL